MTSQMHSNGWNTCRINSDDDKLVCWCVLQMRSRPSQPCCLLPCELEGGGGGGRGVGGVGCLLNSSVFTIRQSEANDQNSHLFIYDG